MIRSMTGYGQARWEGAGRVAIVELRAVNGRYFRLNSRVPHEFAAAERAFEKQVRERISRGSVELFIKIEFTGARAARPLNKEALASYLRQVHEASQGLGGSFCMSLDALASLPGVLDAEEIGGGEAEELLRVVTSTLDAALDEVDRMRLAEGANLREAFLQHCGAMEAVVARVETEYPAALEHYKGRLVERVNRLLADTGISVGEGDLAREIAIYVDRSSVCEEIARVRSHIGQFREALEQREPVGRRLEFLSQEMHREVNTMSSKMGDAELSRQLIGLHAEVDKIREQVLNVE